jgi:hypothetical protein
VVLTTTAHGGKATAARGSAKTKLLRLLAANKGSMNLSNRQLCDLLGYKDPKQVQRYRQILIEAGLVRLGTAYSAGAFAKRHSLSKLAKNMFQAEAQQEHKASG